MSSFDYSGHASVLDIVVAVEMKTPGDKNSIEDSQSTHSSPNSYCTD